MNPYYQDSAVTLYHGDCREVTAWLSADVLVTDPPYGIDWPSSNFSLAKNPQRVKIEGDLSPDLRDAALAKWGSRPALVFGNWRVPRPPKVNVRLIWYKASSYPGLRTHAWYSTDEEVYVIGTGFQGHPEHNVLITHEVRSGATGEVARWGHPTPKPVGLLERLIRKCPADGVIADPFAGVGSTLLAARNLGRRAIGVEIEERYCETIAQTLIAGRPRLRRCRVNPALWLRNRAAAYLLDADHAERRKTISDMTPTTRRAIADELLDCARDVEAALAWEVPE